MVRVYEQGCAHFIRISVQKGTRGVTNGVTSAPGYTGALSDIYQLLSMINQGQTSLSGRTSVSKSSGVSPASKSSTGSSVSGGAGTGSASATQGSSNNGGWGSTHTA